MQVDVKAISGPWEEGFVLDRHVLHSQYLGENADGRAEFDTKYTEAGEALFQLKYRSDWTQIKPIAQALIDNVLPRLPNIDLIVPVPPSSKRARQPVGELAQALGQMATIQVGQHVIEAEPIPYGLPRMKDLTTREEKEAALKGRFKINVAAPVPRGATVLVLDDLFETGASMGAVCTLLQTHPKVANVYAAAVTKTGKT